MVIVDRLLITDFEIDSAAITWKYIEYWSLFAFSKGHCLLENAFLSNQSFALRTLVGVDRVIFLFIDFGAFHDPHRPSSSPFTYSSSIVWRASFRFCMRLEVRGVPWFSSYNLAFSLASYQNLHPFCFLYFYLCRSFLIIP